MPPPRLEDPEPVLAALASGDPAQLAPLLGNDLQPAALRLDPELRRTLRAGTEAGALAGIVSGSGPTCAFLCASASAAVDVGAQLAGAGVCRTVRVASGPVQGARVVPAPSTAVIALGHRVDYETGVTQTSIARDSLAVT